MKDIIEIVKSVEDSGLLLKGVTKTFQNEVKEQKGGFLSVLLGTLGAGLLGNVLTGKGAIASSQGPGIYMAGKGKGINRAGKRIWRAGHWKLIGFFIPPHLLTNFEIQKLYQNEPRFNGVYSRGNLTKIKDGPYIINLDECSDIGIHWVALHVNNNHVTYFDSFWVEHISKKFKHLLTIETLKQTFSEYKHMIQ